MRNSNIYTANHMNYNLSFFSVMGRAVFCICFIIGSENNFGMFGFKIRNKCLSFLLCFILSITRACLLTYYICVVFPDIIFFYIDTWFLNSNNWWLSKNEPFFTNESIFNAFICWLVWSYLIFVLQILLYIYLPILAIVGAFFLIKFIATSSCGAVFKGFCLFFYYMFCFIKNIITGRALTAYIEFIIGLAGGNNIYREDKDDGTREQTLQKFLEIKLKSFDEIELEEKEIECTICLAFI